MNRDTAVNMARELNALSSQSNKTNFVMISSNKAPAFLPAYIDTKIEAENFILTQCHNLSPVIVRPGFIYNMHHRSWSIPLMWGCELLHQMNDKIVSKTPLAKAVDPLFPAKPTKLETVCYFAVEGALGHL